jgi:hypothetical protein
VKKKTGIKLILAAIFFGALIVYLGFHAFVANVLQEFLTSAIIKFFALIAGVIFVKKINLKKKSKKSY